FFNARTYVVGNGNIHGVGVDAARVRIYEKSLSGTLQQAATTSGFSLDYLSLHKVEIKQALEYRHNWDSPSWAVEEV
ncbi:hypothetical protein PHYSODRAFT_421776, partial [Phytophthora sojae]